MRLQEEIENTEPPKHVIQTLQNAIDGVLFLTPYDGGSHEWFSKLIEFACDWYPEMKNLDKDWLVIFLQESKDWSYGLAQAAQWCR